MGGESAHAGEIYAAVAALWRRSRLFQMVVDELAARCLDDAASVRGRVVRLAFAQRYSLGHD